MESIFPINDSESRHRRRHSRHHSNLSLGGMSLNSLTFEDESEEPQNPGHNRKASFQEIPHSLAWSMSDASLDDNEEEERIDARERLLSDDDFRRERLFSDDGRERILSDDNFLAVKQESEEAEEEEECKPSPKEEATNLDERHHEGFEVNLDGRVDAMLLPSNNNLSCFRGLVVASCPEMPTLDGSMDDSGRVSLVLRRARAFSDDTSSIYRKSSSMDSSCESIQVRHYDRSDSMLIDQKYGASNMDCLTESPTSTWVYWEERLDYTSSTSSSPFAFAFQEHHQVEEHHQC